MNLKSKLLVVATIVVAMEAKGQVNTSQRNPTVTQTTASESSKATYREDYLGDDACGSCHRDKIESYHRTAHYLTSRLPTTDSILGNSRPRIPICFSEWKRKTADFSRQPLRACNPT
jgi:hypothetical protein